MTEEWRDIPGFERVYQVSNLGRVQRIAPSNRIKQLPYVLKTTVASNGYEYIRLCRNGVYSTKTVHRLVATCFLENPLNLKEVNHIDGVRCNNLLENLEWVSSSENRLHASRVLYSHPNRKEYIVTTPSGTILEVINLTEFCVNNGITRSGMGDVLSGRQADCHGYTVRYKET